MSSYLAGFNFNSAFAHVTYDYAPSVGNAPPFQETCTNSVVVDSNAVTIYGKQDGQRYVSVTYLIL